MLLWQLLLWILCLASIFGLVSIMLHELLCITDLEVDQISPFDASVTINAWVLPEYALQGALCILLLLGREWIMLLMAVPLTCYHAMLFVKRQHLLDVTEIFRSLKLEKNYRIFKLGFYMVFFAVFMIRFVLVVFNLLRNEGEDIEIF